MTLGACGSPALHSAATSGTLIADPEVVGAWATDEPLQIRAVISPAGSDAKGYTASLTVHNKGEFKTALNLDLLLTEIGSARYADLFLAQPERDKLVNNYGFLIVPVHQVMKLERDGNTLTVRPFRGDWLETHTDGQPGSHDRVAVGGGEVLMITAPTERLRDLLARHADDPRAFGDPIVFHRARD
jgi:hypothetical protein